MRNSLKMPWDAMSKKTAANNSTKQYTINIVHVCVVDAYMCAYNWDSVLTEVSLYYM